MTDDPAARDDAADEEDEEKVYSATLQVSIHAVFDMDSEGAPHLAALGMRTISYEGNVDRKVGSAAILRALDIADLSPDSLTGALVVAPHTSDAKRKKLLISAIPPPNQSERHWDPSSEDGA